jgi:hypothetical protein
MYGNRAPEANQYIPFSLDETDSVLTGYQFRGDVVF